MATCARQKKGYFWLVLGVNQRKILIFWIFKDKVNLYKDFREKFFFYLSSPLTEHIPIFEPSAYSLRSNHPPIVPFVRTERFKSIFSPSSTLSWNQLDPNIQNSSSIEIFKRALLKFIRQKADSPSTRIEIINATLPRP